MDDPPEPDSKPRNTAIIAVVAVLVAAFALGLFMFVAALAVIFLL